MTIRKNVASQKLVFTLVNVATGAVLTGATVTAKLSIDGGASNTASGAVTELANGQYLWSPAQADTNGDSIGVQFTATSAIPVAFMIFTTAANPTDGVRLGLTALPNAAAEAAGGLYTRGSGAGQINQQSNGLIDTNNERWLNTAIATPTVAGVPKVDLTLWLGVAPLALSSQQVQAVVPVTQKVDVETIKTNPVVNGGTLTFPTNATVASTSNITAGTITTATNLTTNNDKTGYALSSAGNNSAADALLARNVAGGSSVGRTVSQAFYFLRNKWTNITGTLTVYETDDATPSWTAAVSTDAAADPIVGNDPA